MRRIEGLISAEYAEIMMYIHERKGWPHLVWDEKRMASLLIDLRHRQGKLIGGMQSIGFHLREETVLESLTQEVVKSSEIEGEILDPSSVRSSVARHLGIEKAAVHPVDKQIEGVVEMMLDATQHFEEPLTKERLFQWHADLFPNGRSGFRTIKIGAWRTGPVEVVSGQMGRETAHFEGPAASRVDHEMDLFLRWFNQKDKIDPVLKSSIAHFWFVTIHPFEDGNGRIARAIGDLMLARSEKSTQRFYSFSAQIQRERKYYYRILEKTQKGDLDITPWIEWSLGCLGRAIDEAELTFETILRKTYFWETISQIPLNSRQRKVLNILLDGFQGKLTTIKWAKIAKCSQDTAYRDILYLIKWGILKKDPKGGRSTSYSLIFPK